MTITVNTVDPEIGAKIYSWVRDGKVIYRGRKAAEVLLARQLEAIAGLKARGIVVKINTIIIPGINDHQVEAVARKMKELGVDLLNCMPVYPNADTPFRGDPRAGARRNDRHSSRGRGIPAADAPLHPLPGRRRGPAGRRPDRGIPGLSLRLRPDGAPHGRHPALCSRGQPGRGAGQSASGGGRFFPDLGS